MTSRRLSTHTHRARIVGVVELAFTDDEVAERDEFEELGAALARHVVAMSPRFLDRASVDAVTLASERRISEGVGDPRHLESFFREACLLEQPFIHDRSSTVGDHLATVCRQLGATITVSRFWRHEADMSPASSAPERAP